jgi:hypothetical protein
MDIRVVREFIKTYPNHPYISCPDDKTALLTNLDEHDIVTLYCLSCKFKTQVGYNLYDKIRRIIGEERSIR